MRDYRADASISDNHGATCLYFAVKERNANAARLLLGAGLDPNGAGPNGWSYLHGAAAAGDCSVLRALIASGANLGATVEDGLTPLHMAAWRGHADATMDIIDAGATPHVGTPRLDLTPLHRAAEHGHAKTVQFLLQRGALADHASRQGRSAVWLAARGGHISTLEELLRWPAGAERHCVQGADEAGWTPLHAACASGVVECVQQLLTVGADLYAECAEGFVPIFHACHSGHSDIARALIARAQSAESPPPRSYHQIRPPGSENDPSRQVPAHLEWYAEPLPLYFACFHGFAQLALSLLKSGANADTNSNSINSSSSSSSSSSRDGKRHGRKKDKGSRGPAASCLYWACRHDQPELALQLLAKGASPHVTTGQDQDSPLRWASEHGRADVALALVRAGADVRVAGCSDVAEGDGRTPLHWAAMEGHTEVVEALLQAGADANAVTTTAGWPSTPCIFISLFYRIPCFWHPNWLPTPGE